MMCRRGLLKKCFRSALKARLDRRATLGFQPLVEQLKEGGRMVIPVGKTYAQELQVLEKRGGVVKQTAAVPVKFVPLTRDPEKK